MEEGKGEDEGGVTGGWAFAVRELCWSYALVVVMNLLRCIRCRDRGAAAKGGREDSWLALPLAFLN